MKLNDIAKVYTENPFVDAIMYYSRYLAINSVIKREDLANQYETINSSKAFTRYELCLNGRAFFDLFDSYPREVLMSTLRYKYTETHIDRYLVADKYQIIEADRPKVLAAMVEWYKENFEETNDYYRILLGLRPSTDTDRILLADYNLNNYESLKTTYTYLDELSLDQLQKLDTDGVIDSIYEDYPDKEYLNNIGKNLDIVTIRKADNFDLIYVPEIDESNIRDEYIERWLQNQSYVIKAIYSEAFKYGSDYYDAFISVLITILTIVDMCNEVQDHMVRKDIFDERCIKYIFEQYGIPYYDEIPVKYQINLMKNLNKLLKFKSTARCMIDICSLFGFDDMKIFQLYLLRDRKVNSDGEYIFNYKINKVPIKCEPTEIKDSVSSEVPLETGHITITLPFDDYFEKGNKIIVYLDDVIVPNIYYYVLEGVLYFSDKSILEGKSRLTYKFLYNETEVDLSSVEDHKILLYEEDLEYNSGVTEYQLHPPIQDYFINEGLVYVILGSIQVSEDVYSINQDSNILTFTNSNFLRGLILRNKNLKIRYFYSSTFTMHHKDVAVLATEKRQSVFKVPEPFENYVKSYSKFYVTRAGTYISPDRYHVTNTGYLVFNSDDDYVQPGRNLNFHFIWNDFNNIDLVEETQTIIATEAYQTEFTLTLPYAQYVSDGNIIFGSVRGVKLASGSYEILKDKFIITDESYAVHKGSPLIVTYVYCKVNNSKHTTQSITATQDKQMEFEVPIPYDGFAARGNKIVVTYRGAKYTEDIDYNIEGTTLYIYNVDKAIDINTNIVFDFYYLEANKDYIKVENSMSKRLSDDQLIFGIEFPYYRYLETGNTFFITIGSIYIDPSLYEVKEDKLIFNDKMWNILKDRNVNFTFIYHTIYEQLNKSVHTDSVSRNLENGIEVLGDDLKVTIPFPFDNYLEYGNTFIMDVDGHTISEKYYDVLDNKYALIYGKQEHVFQYGNEINFTFIYTCTGFTNEVTEDLEKDISLKFVKVPILEAPDKYLKDTTSQLDYDTVISSDPTWNGELTKSDIKTQIINKEFSYVRSKYFSLTAISSMANLSYQLPYFMNIFFDERKTEERLKVLVPEISQSHEIRFNDLIVYMFALTYCYYGIEDDIPDTQDKVLYVRGFNFEANLSLLASKLIEENHVKNPSKCGFDNFVTKNSIIPTWKKLLEIYTQNTEIYDTIVSKMLNATDKDEYDVYKKIYDALMIIKYSKAYYKLPNGEQAPTLTEFLRNRDEYLYNSLVSIKEMDHEDERQKTISVMCQNCQNAVSNYIDTDEFRYIFMGLAGSDTESVIEYITKVINFFKSYKIDIYDKTTSYLFDSKLDNTIRAIDKIYYISKFQINTIYDIFDTMSDITTELSETESGIDFIREAIKRIVTEDITPLFGDRTRIDEWICKMMISILLREKTLYDDMLITFISSIEGIDNYIVPKDYMNNIHSQFTSIDKTKLKENIKFIKEEFVKLSFEQQKMYLDSIVDYLSTFNLDDKILESVKDSLSFYSSTLLKDQNEIKDSYSKLAIDMIEDDKVNILDVIACDIYCSKLLQLRDVFTYGKDNVYDINSYFEYVFKVDFKELITEIRSTQLFNLKVENKDIFDMTTLFYFKDKRIPTDSFILKTILKPVLNLTIKDIITNWKNNITYQLIFRFVEETLYNKVSISNNEKISITDLYKVSSNDNDIKNISDTIRSKDYITITTYDDNS